MNRDLDNNDKSYPVLSIDYKDQEQTQEQIDTFRKMMRKGFLNEVDAQNLRQKPLWQFGLSRCHAR